MKLAIPYSKFRDRKVLTIDCPELSTKRPASNTLHGNTNEKIDHVTDEW